MNTAADPAGPPEETPGAPPSRPDGAPSAPKGGGKAKSARKVAKEPPVMETKPEETPLAEQAESGAPEARPGDGDGGGGPAAGAARWKWKPLIPYALAGLLGGIIVAAILLLTGEADKVQGVIRGRQPDGQAERLAGEAAEQAAALRERVVALSARLDNIDAAASKLADLEQFNKELVSLDTRLARLAGEAARIDSRLGARLETLEALTPNDLPQKLDQAADRQSVETLSERVARLERDELASDVRRAALALALANLTRAAQTSGPFANELSAIEALDPGNEQARALEPFAKSGLPSVPVLASRFDRVADEVVTAHRKAHGKGVLGRLWDNIRDLFRVRPVGEAEGTDAPAIVARAEQRLADGELALAVQELSKLGEPERAAAEKWLEDAGARLRLDRLVSAVNADVLREIAAAQAERKALKEERAAPEAAKEGEAAAGAPER